MMAAPTPRHTRKNHQWVKVIPPDLTGSLIWTRSTNAYEFNRWDGDCFAPCFVYRCQCGAEKTGFLNTIDRFSPSFGDFYRVGYKAPNGRVSFSVPLCRRRPRAG